jgi:hypothetical protein
LVVVLRFRVRGVFIHATHRDTNILFQYHISVQELG